MFNVGGGTEIKIKKKKDRLDDALQATKAALEEGILPGAGIALLSSREVAKPNKDNSDFEKGKQIIYNACAQPFKQILINAGEDVDTWFLKLIHEDKKVPNLITGEIVDAYESGIIDPTKVVRCALENAAAAAVTLLMTECVIHEKPSDKKKEDPMDMMGMM